VKLNFPIYNTDCKSDKDILPNGWHGVNYRCKKFYVHKECPLASETNPENLRRFIRSHPNIVVLCSEKISALSVNFNLPTS